MYAADSQHYVSSLQDKLRALYGLRGGPSIDLTIRPPYLELLRRLGNPHENLPPVIHVAGTNGKGSTIAFLRAMLEAAGKSVHVYTSPHLQRFNERIVVAGREIDDAALENLLDEVVAANGDLPLTFFEITTALAFCAFAREPADILLLETGLGGRLDCTNVIAQPLATIITSIGLDHCEYLGETIEKIAGEKAGIMKRGRPCVVAAQDDPVAVAVLRARAQALGCPFILAERIDAIDHALLGAHQTLNAATALACLAALPELNIDAAARARGLRAAHWPARLQKLSARDDFPGRAVWLDGGHNEPAARALAAQLDAWTREDGVKPQLILAMMKTKDAEAFIGALAPHIGALYTLAVPGEELSCSAADLAQAAARVGARARECADLDDALQATAPGRVLITGSLYLAGHVLSRWLA